MQHMKYEYDNIYTWNRREIQNKFLPCILYRLRTGHGNITIKDLDIVVSWREIISRTTSLIIQKAWSSGWMMFRVNGLESGMVTIIFLLTLRSAWNFSTGITLKCFLHIWPNAVWLLPTASPPLKPWSLQPSLIRGTSNSSLPDKFWTFS